MRAITKEDEQVILSKCLGNIKILRSFLQKQDNASLERFYGNFNTAYQEVCILLEEEKKELAEKEKKRKEVLELIKAEGLDPATITQPVTSQVTKPKSSKKAKYRYETKNGEIKEWTGLGRMPNDLKEKIDSGIQLEQFLI
ncbi:H-NS family nucleoid-associated regulatory protein [Pasteurella multocida]